ncbi:unnamed protein product [Effrenium voratum]|uniref:Helicase ATP-binding domain-containing protein n=1 Tax=Effrenium voratum TaxID=2562239 RepID=A0AA36JAE7_9DINO|nr:unnamed protein product [Effrenium voratum]
MDFPVSKMLAAMSVVCRRGREVSRIRQSSCISVTVETAIFTGSGVFKLAKVKLESYRRHVQVVRALAIQILSALMQPANAEHAKLLGIWRMSILPCYVRPTHNNRGKLCVQNAPTAEFCDRFNAFSPCQNIACWCVRKLRETASLMGGNTLGHIVVATPGRVLDLANKNVCNLKQCHMVAMDEADKLPCPEIQPIIEDLIKFLTPDRQILMYSATFPITILDFKNRFMADAHEINLIKELTRCLAVLCLRGAAEGSLPQHFVLQVADQSCYHFLLRDPCVALGKEDHRAWVLMLLHSLLHETIPQKSCLSRL